MTIRTIVRPLLALTVALFAVGCFGNGDLDFSGEGVDAAEPLTGLDSEAPGDVAGADAAPDAGGEPDTAIDAGADVVADAGGGDTGGGDTGGGDTGGGDAGDVGSCTPVVPYDDVQAIWNSRCTGCHVGGTLGGLSLDKGASAIVGAPSLEVPAMNRIEPGDPSQSYLWLKLNNQHEAAGGTGSPMPVGGYPLPQGDLDTIEAWILGLGPDACP